ncbi:RidA family protein [Streptomyces sp. NBC_01618]|uniref:RidA family protein n=1 Tax=Streptomyces sp. NBC_01618 TaxID=2975900 RepID=UPI00386B5B49|nr:RidA family protein [Streptomyces sp. NBC_01618]
MFRRSVPALAAAAALVVGLGGSSAVADPGARHRVVSTPDAPAAIGPYSQGISAGHLMFVSGQLPIDPKTGSLSADASIEEQTRQVLRNVEAVLKADGMSLKNVVSTTVYVADLDDFARFNSAYAEYFGSTAPPARATVEVARVPRDAKVEISAIAVR